MAATYRPVTSRALDRAIATLDEPFRAIAYQFIDNLPVYPTGYLFNVESPPAKPPGPVKDYLTTPWSVSSSPGKVAMVREETDRIYLIYPLPWLTVQLALAIEHEATQYAQAHPTYKAVIPLIVTHEIDTKTQQSLIELGLIVVLLPRQTVVT
jgi:hypothetical protein